MPPESQNHGSVGRHVQLQVHDISNCLTPVLSYSEAIARELGEMRLPPPQHKKISAMSEVILEAGQKTGRLMRELAACINRQDEASFMHDLNTILSDLAGLLNGIVGLPISLKINCHPYPLLIQANLLLIERLIISLVVNTKESLNPPGCITITTGLSAEAPGSGSLFDRYATISIADTGEGIRTADITHLFDSNYARKSGKRNASPVLASSKLILDCLLGYLSLTANKPKGTVVTAYIPLLQDGKPTDQPTETA